MHLYTLVRGNKPDVDRWVNDLLAIYLPYNYEKGKIGDLQLSVRPVQLFELAFPQNTLPHILTNIWPYDNRCRYATLLRKTMGLKPIPKSDPKHMTSFRKRFPYVSVMGIGIRKDKWINGIEQI